MEFRIANTFTASLAKLTRDEQKAAKTTAFDLQLDPANPGLRFHRVDRTKDPNFWSVSASRDIRIIVYRTSANFLLCYVDHHDAAYRWAERRKIMTHPRTGAAQLIEVRETFEEVLVQSYREQEVLSRPQAPALAGTSRESLLQCGVPEEWLDDLLKADEDQLLDLTEHLPAEAAEALLEMATGGVFASAELAQVAAEGEAFFTNASMKSSEATGDAFSHPDATRRFRLITDAAELEIALEYPWEKWIVFLHPKQRQVVERNFNGPARVSGSAGTGKTIVALHRAVHLASQSQERRVLLTTFSEPLANSLRQKLRYLIGNQPRLAERIDVHSLDTVGERLYKKQIGDLRLVSDETIHAWLAESVSTVADLAFSARFVETEWRDVVDAWQLASWEEYRDVRRLGRKTRLPEKQRSLLWSVFEPVLRRLSQGGLITRAGMFARLSDHVRSRTHPLFDSIVVDEAQDITIAQLWFLAVAAGEQPNSLFFAGDLGQRIFQQPFSWLSQGVDIRGRSQTLHVNYRTSHQIRTRADRLLAPSISDVDGNVEERRGTVSVFNGPAPEIIAFNGATEEIEYVAAWLSELEVLPREVGVFVRSEQEIARATGALESAGIAYRVLDANMDISPGFATVSTMHLAKGLEFRVVVVMACDDEVLPSQARIETVVDESDLEEVYNTERHLLYVACTRARDHLLVTGVSPVSEFVSDLENGR